MAGQRKDGAAESERDALELVTRSYQCRLATLNKDGRSIEATIATEAPVTVFDWRAYEPIDEVLRMDGVKLPPSGQLPLLESHSRWGTASVLGSTRGIRVEGTSLVGTNVFSSAPAAEDAWTKVREGHLTDNSVGYRVLNSVEIQAGQTETVKGTAYTANANRRLRVATEWQPVENSLVPIGADQMAKMRADRHMDNRGPTAPAHTEEIHMGKEQSTEARAGAKDDTREATVEKPAERTEPVTAPATKPVDVDAVRAEAARAENQRQAEIRKLGADCGIPADVIERAAGDVSTTIDGARAMFLESVRKSRAESVGMSAPAMHAKERAMDATVLAASIMLRAGLELVDKRASDEKRKEQTVLSERASDYTGASLVDICRMACELDGDRVPRYRSHQEAIRSALSTVSLLTIFSAVANKFLVAGFNMSQGTALQWCSQRDYNDFKQHKHGRLAGASRLREVVNAQVDAGTVEEWFEASTLKSYAEIVSMSRQDMYNDDLSALTETPMAMGRSAMLLIDDVVYTELLANAALSDGSALFLKTAPHLNLIDGAGTTLQSSQLTALRQLMAKQAQKVGKTSLPLNIRPAYLIVPPELQTTAEQLCASIADPSASQSGVANVWRTLTPISEPRLSDTAFHANALTTHWYLAAAAPQPTIQIGYLRGQRTPTLERFDNEPDTLGIQWRVIFDVCAKALDYRGLARSKGAS